MEIKKESRIFGIKGFRNIGFSEKGETEERLILNYSFHGDHLKACTLGSLNHSSFFVVKKKRKIKQQCVCDSGLCRSLLPPQPNLNEAPQ